MLAQELFQLIGIKIHQNFVASGQDRDRSLIRKLRHLLVGIAIAAHIDHGKLVAALRQVIFGVHAPRAQVATVKGEFGRHDGNKQTDPAPSTVARRAMAGLMRLPGETRTDKA